MAGCCFEKKDAFYWEKRRSDGKKDDVQERKEEADGKKGIFGGRNDA